jgi:trimeric autotransporter adhesin
VAIQVIRGTANGADKALVASVSLTVHYMILAPIILTSFDISKTADNHVSIVWSTATEENVKNMYVERSSDGRNFAPIFTITPVGARNKYTRYAVTDKTPVQGSNYYRLKEVDFDGNVSYFDIKAITINKSGPRFQAFYSGADIKVNLGSIKGEYLLSMYDAGGSHIRSQVLRIPSNSFQTSLPAPQRTGVYIVTLRGEGINETARIFVSK